jgi:hypothetical protein
MQNLSFLLAGRSDSGLTNIWEVRSNHTDVLLGHIKWYAPWQRYTFAADPTIYDAACLTEIAAFLTEQMTLRTQK